MLNKHALLAAAAAAAVLFASCDKQNGDPDPEPEPEPETPELTIPDVILEAYYVGDYNETGNSGNVIVNLQEGDVDVNEDETAYIGSGQIVCLDINVTLPATVTEADHLTLQPGTYKVADDSYAPLTWNPSESYVIKVDKDVVIKDQVAFTTGTIVVEKTDKGSKLTLTAKLDDGSNFTYEYEGQDRVMSHADDSKFSNLDKDVVVGDLTVASWASLGDVVGDGKTETWVVSFGDKHFDIQNNFGKGESVVLYLNVANGAKALPEGKITTFADLNVTEVLDPNTLVAGFFMWGTYGGTWYNCLASGYEAAITGGELNIEKAADGKYAVTGKFVDAYGKKVDFSYEGEIKEMVVDENSTLASTLSVKPSLKKIAK